MNTSKKSEIKSEITEIDRWVVIFCCGLGLWCGVGVYLHSVRCVATGRHCDPVLDQVQLSQTTHLLVANPTEKEDTDSCFIPPGAHSTLRKTAITKAACIYLVHVQCIHWNSSHLKPLLFKLRHNYCTLGK